MRSLTWPAAAAVVALMVLPGPLNAMALSGDAGNGPDAGADLFLQTGTFDPLRDPDPISGDLKLEQAAGYYIMQFTGPVQQGWKDEAASLGVSFYGYIPDYAFLIKAETGVKGSLESLPFVRWVGIYHPGYKLSPNLREEHGTIMMSAMFFDDGPALEMELRALGMEVLWTDPLAVRVRADASMARVMAFMPEVQWVEPFHVPTLLNDNDARILHARQQGDGNFTDDGLSLWSYNASKFEGLATGKGVIVAVQDSGADGNHVDFTNKKVFYKSYFGAAQWTDSIAHGTHVAGTVLGTGQGQAGKYAGLAPEAGLIALQGISMSSIAPESASAASLKDAQDNGADICTNSWGDGSLHGTYGSMAIAYDKAVRDCDPQEAGNQSIIVVFAGGNEDFRGIREPATAKNVITVGATGNNVGLAPDQIASFSSNGPTNDGRRKPDVMAPGSRVTSCQAGTANGYVAEDGTSMAAPGVAGACALVVQYYTDDTGYAPSPAMVKALLANGADIMAANYAYPGNGQGFGRVNVQKSLLSNKTYQILSEDQKVLLRTGEQQMYNASVVTAAYPLKIMLAWTDPPGSAMANKELVNDLDLEVVSPSGVTYYGNNFTNGQSRPGGSPDGLNNLEGFYLKNPELGTWTIMVYGRNIPQGPQDYAIAFSGDIDVSLDFIDLQMLNAPTISPAEPAEGELIKFTAEMRNNGTLPAPNATVRFSLNDRPVANITIPLFKENSTREVSAEWVATRGRFVLKADIDPIKAIREKNESNNLRSSSFEVLYHGLLVVGSASELEVNPGAPAVFNLDVKNSGNANDTYTLENLGGPPPPGWRENLTATNVSVRRISSEQVNLTIWPPGNATVGERYGTSVRVTSDGNSTYTQTVSMSVKVRQVFGLNFTTDSPAEIKALGGETVQCNFTLANPGNGKDSYTVKLAVVGRPTSWKLELSQSNFTLGARGVANLTVKLAIPASAVANDTTTINVSAATQNWGSRSYKIRTMVRQVFLTEITVDGATDRIAPGGNISYRVGLRNAGNGNDTLLLRAAAPPGWTASVGRSAVLLAPNGESTLELMVTCPPGALAGVYEVAFTATASDGSVMGRTINVTVTQLYKLALEIYPSNQTIMQGDRAELALTVTNFGNGNDSFRFTELNLITGWNVGYSEQEVELIPGASYDLMVTVATLNTTPAGNYSFIIKSISQGRATAYATAQVGMELLELPKPPTPPPPPPTPPPDDVSSFLDLPTLLVIIILVVTVAGAGGGYAVHRRKQKLRDAWMPSQPAQVPEAQPVVLEAEPAGGGQMILYPQDPPPPADSQYGQRTWNDFAPNYSDQNRREDYATEEGGLSRPVEDYRRPAGEMTGGADGQDDGAYMVSVMQEKLKPDTAKLEADQKELYDDGGNTGQAGKAQDWLASDGQELADKLPGPLDRWADKGVEVGTGGTTRLQEKLDGIIDKDVARSEGIVGGDRPSGGGKPSGPRFESPDWQPEEAPPAPISAPEPLEPEPAAPPPPPPEYVQVPEPVPPPPPQSAAAQGAPSAPSPTAELDELMKKIRALSNK